MARKQERISNRRPRSAIANKKVCRRLAAICTLNLISKRDLLRKISELEKEM